MRNPVWLPMEGGIVPLGYPSGPLQEEERFAAHERALEDARLEYHLRRLEAVETILGELIPALRKLPGERYALLLASALVLQARLHWRRAERASERRQRDLERTERSGQDQAFGEALALFRKHRAAIPDQLAESRRYTDYGITLYRTGQSEEALTELGNSLKTGAAPSEAFSYIGMAHVALEQFIEAITALRKGLQLAPGDQTLLTTLAKALDKAGGEHLQEAVRVYCQAAIAAGKDGDQATARELLESALVIHPHDPQALSMLTMLLRSLDESDAAMEVLDRTLQSDGADPWAIGLRGMLLRGKGRIEEAIAAFRSVEVKSRDLAWILLEQAQATAASDPRGARRLVRRAGELLGENDNRVMQAKLQIEVQAALAGLAPVGRAAAGVIESAFRAIAESAVARNVGDFAFTLLEKYTRSRTADPDQVIAALHKTIVAWPENIEARQELARVLLDQGRHTEAAAAIEEALALAPDSASLLGLKARLLDAQNNPSEALRFYRRAARAAPENDDAFIALIAALTRTDRREDALSELDRKLAGSPDHGLALAEKGALLYTSGRLDEARTTLEAAEQALDPSRDANLLPVLINLAHTLRGLDLFEEAGAAFDRAIAREHQPPFDARDSKAVLLIDIAEYQKAAALLADTVGLLSAADGDNTNERLGWLHSARGWALDCAGGVSCAELEDIYRTALRFSPQDVYAKKNLGSLLLLDGDGERRKEGEALLIGLTEAALASGVPLQLVSWCHFLLGKYDAAEHWLRATLPSKPDEANTPVTDDDIAARFDLALVLLAAEHTEAPAEYALASAQARQRPAALRRGLLHVAARDLIKAADEGRIDRTSGLAEWERLRAQLVAAEYPCERLDVLIYPQSLDTIRDRS